MISCRRSRDPVGRRREVATSAAGQYRHRAEPLSSPPITQGAVCGSGLAAERRSAGSGSQGLCSVWKICHKEIQWFTCVSRVALVLQRDIDFGAILLRIECFVKNPRGAYDLRSDLTLLAALLDLNSQMDPRRDRRESVDAAAREILWVLEGLSSEFKTLGRDKRESVGLALCQPG